MSGCVPRTFPTCTDLSILSMEKMRHNSTWVSLGHRGLWIGDLFGVKSPWVATTLPRVFCSTQLRIEYNVSDLGIQYKFFSKGNLKKNQFSESIGKTIFTSYTFGSFLLGSLFHFAKQIFFL